MSLRSMPIATRAALSFALITALLVITGIFSLNRMGSLNEASSDISDNWLPSVRESAELNVLLAELRQVQLAHVLAADDSSKRFLESRMTEIGKELTDREGAYQRLISGADERSIYERYLATRQTLLQSQQTLVQMSRSKPLEETRQYTESTLLDQYRATQQQLQALIDFNVKGASQASHTADEVYDSAFAAVIGVLLVAGLATVVLAWLFTRSITQPIGEALRVAEVIASGDLTSRIDTSGRDEPAKLLVALQGMQAQLRQTIQQIGSSATQLASAAEELSAVTEQGNRSLTQQNDEIQMAATAVNEMTAAVEEVARNARSTSTFQGLPPNARERRKSLSGLRIFTQYRSTDIQRNPLTAGSNWYVEWYIGNAEVPKTVLLLEEPGFRREHGIQLVSQELGSCFQTSRFDRPR